MSPTGQIPNKPDWRGVSVGVSGSVTAANPLGAAVEGKYCVWHGWVFVEGPEGQRIGARQLSADENPKEAARGILRTTRAGRGDPYAHLFYSKKSQW